MTTYTDALIVEQVITRMEEAVARMIVNLDAAIDKVFKKALADFKTTEPKLKSSEEFQDPEIEETEDEFEEAQVEEEIEVGAQAMVEQQTVVDQNHRHEVINTILHVFNTCENFERSGLMVLVTWDKLIAIMDPYGFRLLVMGNDNFVTYGVLGFVKTVTLDDEVVELWNLSSRFVFTESDVGKNKALATVQKLQELNNAVIIFTFTTKLIKERLSDFQAVVFTDISFETANEFNDYCHNHQPPIFFIMGEVRGLFGSIFCDFGPEFTVVDVDREDPHTGIIASICNDNPTLIYNVDFMRGVENELPLVKASSKCYAKVGFLEVKVNLFRSKKGKYIISWSSMIDCYCHHGVAVEALHLLTKSINKGCQSNAVSVLPILFKLKLLKHVKEKHHRILQKGLEYNIFMGAALIRFFQNIVLVNLLVNKPSDSSKIEEVVEKMKESIPKVEGDYEGIHYFDIGTLTVQYLFVLDALNFRFWPDKDLNYEHLAKGSNPIEDEIFFDFSDPQEIGIPGATHLKDCGLLENVVKKQVTDAVVSASAAVTIGSWDLLKGLKATCYLSFREQLTSYASVVESRFQQDGKVVTSRGPDTTMEFVVALVEHLYSKEEADEVYRPLVMRPNHDGSEEKEAVMIIDILQRAKANIMVASVGDNLEILIFRKIMIQAIQRNITDAWFNGGIRLDVVLNQTFLRSDEAIRISGTFLTLAGIVVLAIAFVIVLETKGPFQAKICYNSEGSIENRDVGCYKIRLTNCILEDKDVLKGVVLIQAK